MGAMINIGTDELVKFTNRLEKMRKSDLPVVVRQTLNKAAFDMRKKSLPKTYKKAFTERDKNFLRSRSRVEMAQGFDIKSMESKAGIVGNDITTRGLAMQSRGGTIPNRAFIPMPMARTSNSMQKKVRKKARLSQIAIHHRVREGNARQMIKTAWKTGAGGHLLYGDTMFEIRGIRRQRGGNSFIKMKPLYSYEKGREVTVSKKPYVQEAAIMEGQKINKNFVAFAQKRIRR